MTKSWFSSIPTSTVPILFMSAIQSFRATEEAGSASLAIDTFLKILSAKDNKEADEVARHLLKRTEDLCNDPDQSNAIVRVVSTVIKSLLPPLLGGALGGTMHVLSAPLRWTGILRTGKDLSISERLFTHVISGVLISILPLICAVVITKYLVREERLLIQASSSLGTASSGSDSEWKISEVPSKDISGVDKEVSLHTEPPIPGPKDTVVVNAQVSSSRLYFDRGRVILIGAKSIGLIITLSYNFIIFWIIRVVTFTVVLKGVEVCFSVFVVVGRMFFVSK